MKKIGIVMKILAVLGTLLTWFPILALLVFASVGFARGRTHEFDYFIPGELFPVVFIGGALLGFVSIRTRLYWKLIWCSYGAAIVMLVCSQAIAVWTGLASGAIQPEGLPWIVVNTMIWFYNVSLPVLGVGGIRLVRHLFRK